MQGCDELVQRSRLEHDLGPRLVLELAACGMYVPHAAWLASALVLARVSALIEGLREPRSRRLLPSLL
ncbi:hypothetical protein [Nannocystis pusilla]|uniref:hypothetical protein n=1 Tax=Nannocystis pusilla TaxID=889268 RepID=UPI003B7A8FCB